MGKGQTFATAAGTNNLHSSFTGKLFGEVRIAEFTKNLVKLNDYFEDNTGGGHRHIVPDKSKHAELAKLREEIRKEMQAISLEENVPLANLVGIMGTVCHTPAMVYFRTGKFE
jgi:hypothetical protein